MIIPSRPEPPEQVVKFIRTLHNQLIIGKVQEFKDTIVVSKPYNVQPTHEGIQIHPMDQEIVGVEIEEIILYKSNLMYFIVPSQDLSATYLTSISGIETEPKKELIL